MNQLDVALHLKGSDLFSMYTSKNERRLWEGVLIIEQYFAANIVHGCWQYWKILLRRI